DRAKQARERFEALKPKLAQLTISVPDAIRALPNLSITRDGVPIGAAQWGTPVPVDKGKHVVAATATGKQRWEQVVDVAADRVLASVDVPVLADAPAAGSAGAPSSVEKPDAEGTSFWGKQHIAGAVVTGVGLVSVVIGSVLGGLAISKKNQSNDGHCLVN